MLDPGSSASRRLFKQGRMVFDGNMTDDCRDFWFLIGGEGADDRNREMATAELMEMTAKGHISWVLVPTSGFRL